MTVEEIVLKKILIIYKALELEIQQLSHKIVFTETITLPKMPKTNKKFARIIRKVLMLNECRCPWLDLTFHDSFLNDVYLFGRERDIVCNLKEIVKRIIIGRECRIGKISISFSSSGKLNIEDLI